jgi:sugar O-acyltransferase (sialic acid O-acetyltransferase NeuD family)
MQGKNELVIVGIGGQAKEIAQLARQMDPQATRWETISYVTENKELLGRELPYGKISYLDDDVLRLNQLTDIVIGAGLPHVRQRMHSLLQTNNFFCYPNIISPDSRLDMKYIQLGKGNVIAKGAALTCDIVIGDFNLLNTNSTIGHDSVLRNFNTINPGANVSGNVHIDDQCLIGTGAQILQGLHITSGTTIGAGGVVTRSINVPGTYVGIPAKAIKS